MKITFINPNFSGVVGQNIGLAYVISATEAYHKVDFIDLTFNTHTYKNAILEKLDIFKPDIIGFSVNTFTFCPSLSIAQFVKSAYPDAGFIWGGVHPTLLPEETISHPLVDAICIGDGERALPEYLDKLEDGKEPKVAGIWYKDKAGNVIRNPVRPFEDDLDSLPFPNWDWWDIERYLKEELFFTGGLRHLASRGCPYSCSFCSNPAIRASIPGRYYRLRSPPSLIEEIKNNLEKYKSKGFRNVFFSDEIFGLNKIFLKKFCQAYIDGGLSKQISWSCSTRAEIITEEWALNARRAGCVMVSFGIESGDDFIRNHIYNKKVSQKEILNAVSILKSNDIAYHVSFIVGGPNDTKRTINKSMRLVDMLRPIGVQYMFYQPLPNTALYKQYYKEKTGIFDISHTYTNSPRVGTGFVKKNDLYRIKIKLGLNKLFNFIIQGVRLKKHNFLVDIIRFCSAIKNINIFLSGNIHLITYLEQNILYTELIRRWRRDPTQD